MKEYANYSLLNHNTFGMNVETKRFVEYDSEEELIGLLPSLGNKFLHMGGGSNLLFLGNFDGTVLHSAIRGIEVVENCGEEMLVRVGAGVVWDDFVAWAVEQGWGGIENLSLIPGEVGASAVQNIGAYGVEAKDVIVRVEAIHLKTGEKRCFMADECGYAYRQSVFKNELKGQYAITYVTYKLAVHPTLKLGYGNMKVLSEKENVTVADIRQFIIDVRNAKLPDPKVLGNAGSFFMNPVVSRDKFRKIQLAYPQMPYYEVENGVKIPAGWMIEQCGWKGKSLGRAGVHEKQALVLVNLGGASSEEIVALCNAVCKDVKDTFGIDIHPEVNFIS
ncbi:MAG: UDP-N-acetylmuramate dehydrogenase [Bacteroidaceae bacterium]|nr:UDP-N-acetylmuramate dehydrogenase [Bacteroidaceae bacterium]